MLVEPFILKLKVLELFQSITFSSQSLTFCNEHAWVLHCLNVSIYFPRIRNKNPQSTRSCFRFSWYQRTSYPKRWTSTQ